MPLLFISCSAALRSAVPMPLCFSDALTKIELFYSFLLSFNRITTTAVKNAIIDRRKIIEMPPAIVVFSFCCFITQSAHMPEKRLQHLF